MFFTHYDTQGDPGNSVQLISNNFDTFGESVTVFSGLKAGADGNLSERQEAGGYSVFGQWLLKGTAATFYISRTTSDTLDTDAGAGPLQMNTDREYDVQRSAPGITTATVQFDISDDVSGVPIIASIVYEFLAEKETGG